jgi:hypothetical protein
MESTTINRADLQAQCGMMVAAAPEAVRRAVIADKQFARDMGLKITSTLTSQLGYVVETREFTLMLREAVEGTANITFRTSDGEAVAATASVDADGAAHLATPKGTLIQPLAALLGDDQSRRMATFATFAAQVMLPAARAKEWRDLVAGRPLAADEFWELCGQTDKTPEALHDRLQQLQTHDVPTIVPAEDLYWECLLPAPVDSYAAWRDAALPTWRMELIASASRWKLSRAGFAAVCRTPMPLAFVEGVDQAALDALCRQEDPFSLLLALEITAAGAALDEVAVTRGTDLLRRLLGETDEASRRIGLFWAAMIVAHAGAQRSVKWRKAPLYWRRVAVLAQAGLITNALFHAYPDAPTFMSWAGSQGGMTFALGTIRDRREAPHWNIMSTGAVRAMVVERACIAVASVPADRRPPEWASLTEAAMKDGGDLTRCP